ncbi:GNAT family N-acetyltransferase [Aliiglaciecola sp. CAU 1673]|uniref:GNAT family N-acetyltransferase n=1 Tax=Aliiglaciecola sp. CAU 1673 TaxID=3032595 RepID=UPI0023DA8793|nr:GNAT family N-acetyltransferase [Aliiglaciecola sp. CAU 1673]MDF2178127.1 GNAT family N-acetyltransferase [Aliiglaciecola sp. CAU 1673]
MPHHDIEFLPFSPELARYFESINRQWIEAMFVMEQADQEMLSQPQRKVIEPGGRIWFARHPQLGIVGTCALMNKGQGAYELTKMGVLAEARSLKVGEKLLRYVLEQAKSMSMECLFLLTNERCEAAIHLYEKNGFEHCADIMQRFGKAYKRCDVAMRYRGIGA